MDIEIKPKRKTKRDKQIEVDTTTADEMIMQMFVKQEEKIKQLGDEINNRLSGKRKRGDDHRW